MSNNITTLIDIFRMNEISSKVRANLIIKLGNAMNHEMGSNITEPIVYELVLILDKNNKILTNDHYLKIVFDDYSEEGKKQFPKWKEKFLKENKVNEK